MKPFVERWERDIIAAGQELEPEVSEEELKSFAAHASNPDDVKAFLTKPEIYFNNDNRYEEIAEVDYNEEVDSEQELEIVLTDDDEEYDSEEDGDEDFIVDAGGLENEEEITEYEEE